MAKAKILKIKLAVPTEDALCELEKAKVIVKLLNKDNSFAYVAARNVNKSTIKKFIKADEEKTSD